MSVAKPANTRRNNKSTSFMARSLAGSNIKARIGRLVFQGIGHRNCEFAMYNLKVRVLGRAHYIPAPASNASAFRGSSLQRVIGFLQGANLLHQTRRDAVLD